MTYEVTIGIPVYNVEKYIRQTLDSALAQTFQSIEFTLRFPTYPGKPYFCRGMSFL